MYHCKAAGGDAAGDRTSDAYEVSGQAIKSTKFRNKKRLLSHVRARVVTGSVFVKGSLEDVVDILEPDPRYDIPLSIIVVQPGFSRDGMSQKTASILMGVDRAVASVGCANISVICSQ